MLPANASPAGEVDFAKQKTEGLIAKQIKL